MDFTFKLGTGILTTARAESPRNIIGIFLRMALLGIYICPDLQKHGYRNLSYTPSDWVL